MAMPIGNWPICHSIPAMFSLNWKTATGHVKTFGQKLHNLGFGNLLQVAHAILTDNDHEIQTVCTNNEFKILLAYTYASTVKDGMEIQVTWKSENKGDPDATYTCVVAGNCREGRAISVLCEGGVYDVCLYLDDVEIKKDILLGPFQQDYPQARRESVYMIDYESKAFYFAKFTKEGEINGPCRVEGFDGKIVMCEYKDGVLVTQ